MVKIEVNKMPKKQIQLFLDQEMVDTIDKIIKKCPEYSNRTQFLRKATKDLITKIIPDHYKWGPKVID